MPCIKCCNRKLKTILLKNVAQTCWRSLRASGVLRRAMWCGRAAACAGGPAPGEGGPGLSGACRRCDAGETLGRLSLFLLFLRGERLPVPSTRGHREPGSVGEQWG